MKASIKLLFLFLLTLTHVSYATELAFAKEFALSVEKWTKGAEGQFFPNGFTYSIKDKKIILPFDHSSVFEYFDGFTLEIESYMGHQNKTMTIEQNLSKEGHPLNDEVIGISRNHFTINNPQGNQMSYVNYYVNVDENTKYRIRLWDIYN